MKYDKSNRTAWLLEGWWQAALVAVLATAVILVVAFLITLPFSETSSERSAWVQGVGTIMALVGGFIGILYQAAEQRRAKAEDIAANGRAAQVLAGKAYELVTDRLKAALNPGKAKTLYVLRGFRTTEMVASMQEFAAGTLPSTLIPSFTTLRACVFAVNARISEIYAAENRASAAEKLKLVSDRVNRLESVVRAHEAAALALFELNQLAISNCNAEALIVEPSPVWVPEPVPNSQPIARPKKQRTPQF